MASIYFIDVPDYAPLWESAVGDSDVEVGRSGSHVEVSFPDGLTIDRAATGVRHAIWYSGVAALRDATVVRFDKEALRVEAV